MEHTLKGLTAQEVIEARAESGLNRLTPPQKAGILQALYSQFNNFLTVLLLIAGFVSLGIGELIDGSLILTIVVLNAFFGLYQERKAEAAIDALSDMTVTKARIIRDGEEVEVDSQEIVPGDILHIEEGAKVPADAHIVKSFGIEINESALTGESLPVVKREKDEVYMGTIVAKGRAFAKVHKTGDRTKFGAIASHLAAVERQATPLQKKLEGLSKVLGGIGIAASVCVLVLSHLQGSSYLSSFLLAVSLAVAVVPEGLPAVLTITLAIGVKEMAKRKAIVRKLSAVEAFGSITLIATDKTGTLTENKMRVKEIWEGGVLAEISRKKQGLAEVDKITHLGHILTCGVMCSTASLVPVHDKKRHAEDEYDVLGDPTEGALLMLSEHFSQPYENTRKSWQLLAELPFDSVTKRMSVLIAKQETPDQAILYSKGAPESVLNICDSYVQDGKVHKLTNEARSAIEQAEHAWARKGLRILALSYKPDITPTKNTDVSKQVEGSVFLGMVALHDGPRPEAKEAIDRARTAGIRVVMITGDNEYTAEAIGTQVGIMQEGDEIINGNQIEKYSDQELMRKLPKIRIFARTTPFHKSRIVELYQKMGEVVAVTGDGVNDSIALKKADVGVAMGLVGTDVARETADMVITDDNFATIVNAIEQGRHIIKNVNSAIVYLLSCNIVEAISLISGLAMGIPHLFYPIQLLYVNLVTDGLPALAIAYSPQEQHLMKQPPTKTLALLGPADYRYIAANGILGSVLVFIGYFIFHAGGGAWAEFAGQAAAFSVLVIIQSFVFVDVWFHHRSVLAHIIKKQPVIFYAAVIMPIVLQLIIVRTAPLAQLFNILPLGIAAFALLIVISSFILVGLRIVVRRGNV